MQTTEAVASCGRLVGNTRFCPRYCFSSSHFLVCLFFFKRGLDQKRKYEKMEESSRLKGPPAIMVLSGFISHLEGVFLFVCLGQPAVTMKGMNIPPPISCKLTWGTGIIHQEVSYKSLTERNHHWAKTISWWIVPHET